MKIDFTRLIVAVSLAIVQNVRGQNFVNLDFEDATIVPVDTSPYYPYAVYADAALPGWTVGPGNFQGTDIIIYNDISLGATAVELFGINSTYSPAPLDGDFSVWLYGGEPGVGASISQTGQIPSGVASIRLIARGNPNPATGGGPLLLSLNGQNIPLVAITPGPNYTLYGGNIAAFAGQVEQLTFAAPAGVNYDWELDDVQFSSLPVPEPGSSSVLGIGAVLVYLVRMRSNKTLQATAAVLCCWVLGWSHNTVVAGARAPAKLFTVGCGQTPAAGLANHE